MIEALRRIREYTACGEAAFRSDTRTQDAVIRNFEILGEAAKRVSDQPRQAAPEIPWKQAAAMRDKLIHDYFGVSLDVVWDTASVQAPQLEAQLLKLQGPRQVKQVP
jgi:hypothetical protein